MGRRNAGFVVVCENDGTVRDVMVDDLFAPGTLVPGVALAAAVIEADADKVHRMLGTVTEHDSAFGWEVVANGAEGPVVVNLNAAAAGDGTIVVGSPSCTDALEMLAEVVRINSELVTHVRGLSKQWSVEAVLPGRTREMDDFTRLNNELMGLQRELARNNVELERSRRLVSSIVDIAPTIIYIYDFEAGRVVFANQGVQRLLGYTQTDGADALNELFEAHLDEYSDAERTCALREISGVADGEVIEWDLHAQAADGSWRTLHTRETVFARGSDGRVTQMIGTAQDVTEQRETARRLQELALADPLTGLHNKRGFEFLAATAMEHASRVGEQVGVLFLDLDGFKAINDTYGHAAGDEALQAFAQVLRLCVRKSDVVARLGGDEFVVLMVEGAASGLTALPERIREELASTEGPGGTPLSASIGTALGEGPAVSLQRLLTEADVRMYAEKNTRKIG